MTANCSYDERLERGYHQLQDHARSLGIATLDLVPALAAARERQIFFRHDPHLTVAGNRVVGETVAAFLVERGLVGSISPDPSPASSPNASKSLLAASPR